MTKLKTALIIAAQCGLLLSAAASDPWEDWIEDRVQRMSAAERRLLDSRHSLSVPSLQAIAADITGEKLHALAAEILALDSLAVESRAVDENGQAAIHRYLYEKLSAYEERGLEILGSLKQPIAVPVSLDRLLDPNTRATAPAALTVGDESWRVSPLWANGPLPSLCPEDGLAGRLVYVAQGEWEDLQGLDIDDAIALMDFGGGRNWERLFKLGAKAVVVCEDSRVGTASGARLFCQTPVPCPRFLADSKAAAELIALAERRVGDKVVKGNLCRLTGGALYENRPTESIFAYLPPTEPMTYTVSEKDLLERIVADTGMDLDAVLRENNLDSPRLTPGQELLLPGTARSYKVKQADLLHRLAKDFGIPAEEFAFKAGLVPEMPAPGDDLPELEPGRRLTVPNIDRSLFITVRINSVCVAPDQAHGAYVAGNLAVALLALDHLAGTEGIHRRQGVIFAFIDGDTHGGQATRAFAETLLQERGELLSAVSEVAEVGSGMYRFFALLVCLAVLVPLISVGGKVYLKRKPESKIPPYAFIIASVALALAVGFIVPLPSGEGAEGVTSEEMMLNNYRDVLAWFESDGDDTLGSDTGAWFVEDWLQGKVEKLRIDIAEGRLVHLLAENNAETEAEKAVHTERRRAADKDIQLVAKLRDETILSKSKSYDERLHLFVERLRRDSARYDALGFTVDKLVARIRAEYEEEASARATRASNVATVHAVEAAVHPEGRASDDSKSAVPVAGLALYLSDATPTLSPGPTQARSVGLPGSSILTRQEERLLNLAALSAWRGGWKPAGYPFAGQTRLPGLNIMNVSAYRTPALYEDFYQVIGVKAFSMMTANDFLPRMDTPADTLDNLNVANMAAQGRTLLVFLKTAIESTTDLAAGSAVKADQYGRLIGKAVKFNIRSGIDARDPVPGAYVYEPDHQKRGGGVGGYYADNAAGTTGGRRGVLKIVRLSGTYTMPVGTILEYKRFIKPTVLAYRLNRRQALFDMVMEHAPIGTKKQGADYRLIAGRDVEKNIVLTKAYPLTLFWGSDPMGGAGIPSPQKASLNYFALNDAVLDAAPRHYAIDSPWVYFREGKVESKVLYVPEGRRIRLEIDDGAQPKLALTGEISSGKSSRGAGYYVGPREGDRNLALNATSLLIARDLYAKAVKRRDEFYQFGIRDQSVEQALERAEEKLALSDSFKEQQNWMAAIGAARECWGIVLKVYPAILTMGRESVFSVLFLMLLMLPFSIFIERLVISAKTILAKLAWVAAIFSLCTVYLYFFHPAYKIAVSPFVIVVAFVMIIMSAFVLGLCYQRFDVLVRRARIAAGEVESEEISFVSSLTTAFNLGVNNLRKRPVRTVLTAFTVCVLTFSIITFVSVTGKESLLRRELELDTDVEGEQVEPYAPAYNGIMFRNPNWAGGAQDPSAETEYGQEHELVRRASYIERRGGNNADLEGANQVLIEFGGRKAIVNGVMAFEPAERRFSGLHKAVSRNSWFRAEDRAAGIPEDRLHIILPDRAAESLGITETMIFDEEGRRRPDKELPVVRMLNNVFHVTGILDVEEADRYRDINGKSLASVDYVRSGITPNVGVSTLDAERRQYHWSWRRLAIVPMAAKQDINAQTISLVVKFNENVDFDAFTRDLALRKVQSSIVCMDGKSQLLSVKTDKSVGGLAKIVVPIILCILIVANTMLGTIEERRGEVGMLGAVGLSPRQIAFLLLSEATVFSVLGIIFGVFAGLAFSKLMLIYPQLLGGLSFNFTSMASTTLAMGTGLVVLLATLIPAARAAAMAAPSGMGKWVLPEPNADGSIDFFLPFTLTRGNAVGMIAFMRRFMLNHTEATSEDFNCRRVGARIVAEPEDRLSLTAQMWLAPYDLDVAQDMELAVVPTESDGVFQAGIRLHRTSGNEDAWLRTNYAFLDLVRLQFLLWRNMTREMRAKYIQEGAESLKGA